MLNSKALQLITLFILLLLPGIFFGNLVLVGMSLVPLLLLILGLAFSPPRVVAVDAVKINTPVWAGDVSPVARTVRTSAGVGLVKLYQPLPPEFDLVEGSNLMMHWQWFRPVTLEMSFRLKLAKRGRYTVPPLDWVSLHPLGYSGAEGSGGNHIDVEVWPRFYLPKTVKSLPGLSVSPFPSSDIAKIGIPGQDFREIRKYVTGDPIKNINWRATARRAEQSFWPLVNEFEREGRKSVMIYLHASQAVEIGNTIENGIESGLEATCNLLYYFLEKGYRTGIYVCSNPPRYFSPDTGRLQFRKVLRQLIDLKPGYWPKELLTAVEITRDYVLGYNPLSIVISTLDNRSGPALEKAVHQLRQYYSRRRKPSIMVIGIDAYGLVPQANHYENELPALLRLQSRPLVRRLRGAGANVIEWHPDHESFSRIFSRQVWVK
jgi:uncharacterized protein (DUF58 family)